MIRNRLGALGLAAMLALSCASAFAGSTGPTNPVGDGPKVPGTGAEKNVDGTSPGAPGTSPGTKGMDPLPGKNGSAADKPHDSKQPHDANHQDSQGEHKAP
ncbi:Uncharacterized protein ALO82_04412 [Pseudomonas syringae pv. broussonetiae]|uniref:Lipoprotein n=1 Tax=Pseudomonas savastanoi TaxID=29438 RepID=A0A3M5B247_PSESS|nr:hypothetical protein [Pseudomonas savastanoi]KPW49213.1 Uncharacterized protein ALO82_04412 [Pseudomonas syringae pv. broussonetiae]KWT00744.1 hypothetical protein AL047_05215 [Pseudomonas syringae pv. broussonetiae]RMS19344.1 hypothetical protein ALP70_04496 [Pseudomonas savastanoi]RMT32506.1 hypothetical protein ALP51_04527 [Pseudomonas savastanoi]